MALNKLICVAAVLMLLTKECDSQLSVCGQPALNTRIVGGEEARPGSWPWQVSLHYLSSHICGGSLLNDRWILTAAHCVDEIFFPSSLTVYLGRETQDGPNPNEVSRIVSEIIMHSDYNTPRFDNDIALLTFSEPVTFTSYISPVCLASLTSTFYSGVDSWVTGWGNIGKEIPLPSPGNLLEVEVQVVGNNQCRCDYRESDGVITNQMICAGIREGGKGICQGDSGGPLVSKQGGRWIQAGIVSFAVGCAQPNFPAVYARVSQFENWIKGHISTNQPGFLTFVSNGTDDVASCSTPINKATPTMTTSGATFYRYIFFLLSVLGLQAFT